MTVPQPAPAIVRPLFSIVTVVHEPPADAVAAMVESVVAPRFAHWELCLVNDSSTDADVTAVLSRAVSSDPRIRLTRRLGRGGSANAANDGLAAVTGEFVAFVDPLDRFRGDALAAVARAIEEQAPVDVVYTDEAQLESDGRCARVVRKPEWSPERLRSQFYVGQLTVMRRTLVEAVGGFRPELGDAAGYDLVLRVTERTDRIVHVPEVLFLRGARPGPAGEITGDAPAGSSGVSGPAEDVTHLAGCRAVQEHCDRVGIDGTVEPLVEGGFRVRRRVRDEPLVSIVIPTCGSTVRVAGSGRAPVERAVRSVIERSTYANVELVVAADCAIPSTIVSSLEALGGDRLRVLPIGDPFRFSTGVNAGALEASGDVVLVLHDGVEVATPDWIETLVALVHEPDCGVAGAALQSADGVALHGGYAFFDGQVHVLALPAAGRGRDHGLSLHLDRECSAVSSACVALRRAVFEEVGGFCELLPIPFADVDLCSKIRQLGYRVVWTPHAVLLYDVSGDQEESAAEGTEVLHDRWGHLLHQDPYASEALLRPTRP